MKKKCKILIFAIALTMQALSFTLPHFFNNDYQIDLIYSPEPLEDVYTTI